MVEEYLTPLALAVWIMNDGGAVSYGLKIATNNFTLIEVNLLCEIINRKYGLKARPGSAGVANQYIIYIPSVSMPVLARIIGPHMHPSMYYKIKSHL
jgi:ubiquinol-cytochrome c reductase cytochrome b subunit